MADLFAETALSMGMDAKVMREELGLSEGSPQFEEDTSNDWTQSRTETGNLHSPGTPSGRRPRPETGDDNQVPVEEIPSPPQTLTDEQIDALKDELGKMGLDVDLAMNELGLGQGAAASQSTASQSTSLGGDKPPGGDEAGTSGGAVKDFKPPKPPAGDLEQGEPPQDPTPTSDDDIPTYQENESKEDLSNWYNAALDTRVEKGDKKDLWMLDYLKYYKEMELWMKDEGTWQALKAKMASDTSNQETQPSMEVVEGKGLQDVLDLVYEQKEKLSQNASKPYTLANSPETDPSLKPPYVNIWNPLETGLSTSGLQMILLFEEKRNYPYNDSDDPEKAQCTVGYGHVLPGGSPCTPDQEARYYTENEILEFLVTDMNQAEKDVRRTFQDLDNAYRGGLDNGNPLPINQQQFDSLTSLAFNIGGPELNTLLFTVVRQDDNGEVVFDENLFREMMLGKYSEREPGLRVRREQELDLFFEGVYGEGY